MLIFLSGQGGGQPQQHPQPSADYSHYYEQYYQNYAAWQNYGNYYDPTYAYAQHPHQQGPPPQQPQSMMQQHYQAAMTGLPVSGHLHPIQQQEDEFELVGKLWVD